MPDAMNPSLPGGGETPMPDGVVILEPGDERAQKIAKAMASRTAGEILQLLKEGSHASTQIAEALSIPITTVQYHLENLVDAGIITVVERRWSQKGREVKVYGLRDRMLIVVPRGGDLKGILLRYGSLFAVVALASLVLALAGPALAPAVSPAVESALPAAVPPVPTEAGVAANKLFTGVANQTPAPVATMVTRAVPELASTPAGIPWLPLAFFLGGVLVIAVMMGYELWKWHRVKGSP